MESAFPEAVDIGQNIGFATECQCFIFIALAGIIRRHNFRQRSTSKRVYTISLDSDFVGGVDFNIAAGTGIDIAAIFPDNDKIDMFRAFIFNWSPYAGIKFYRPEVDVLI